MSEEEGTRTGTSSVWKNRIKRHVPLTKWLPGYRKSDLVADAVAGITLGLTLIPQSIAYASLAGVSAEYGLYSSFLGGFIYFFFGTVKEVSVGPTSLVSLLTFEFTGDLPPEFVFFFTFMCGIVQFLCGVVQFGFLVNFISMPVITSFQSATSLIIISSQLKDFFGVPKFKSGRFLDNVLNVIKRMGQANLADVGLSLFCCVFLMSLRVRQLTCLRVMKEKQKTTRGRILRKVIWFVSISRNAFCVLISCLIAYGFSGSGEPPFRITGNIPTGLPTFEPPKFSSRVGNETLSFVQMVYEISPGLMVVPLITILANVTIAKAFSQGGPVDATQEMLTLGLCNMSGSFFGSVPTCGAFTRSAVSNSSGVRTPLSGLFTGTLIILVIKFLTPYFYYIPRACLASVLICAVIFMVDVKTIWFLRRANKRDFVCAILTFTTSLLVGIQIGLLLGITMCIGHLLYMWARPTIDTEVKVTKRGNYYLVTPDIGLFYPATDSLRNEIISRCGQDIPVVVDCLHIKGVDYTTAQGIKELARYFKARSRTLAFVNMSRGVYLILKNSNVELTVWNDTTEGVQGTRDPKDDGDGTEAPTDDGDDDDELGAVLYRVEKPEVPIVVLTEKRRIPIELVTLKCDPEEKALMDTEKK